MAGTPPREPKLDRVDEIILYHLVQDARRVRAPQIAEAAGVAASTVRNRIRALEAAGVIQGYHAMVDYEKLGGRIRNLFLCTAPILEREELAQAALEVPGVVHVRSVMTGTENLHVTAIAPDTDDLNRIARHLSELGLAIEDEDLVRHEHHQAYAPFEGDGGEV